MDLSNLSKYRSHIMGMATIFITLCHTSLVFSESLKYVQYAYAVFVVNIMQFGVDIFLLLSGLGCYFSYAKQTEYYRFEKKRLLRLLTPYIIVIIPVIIFDVTLNDINPLLAIYQESLISFFISGHLNLWFIGAILLLYIFFPLVFNLVNKDSRIVLSICAIFIAIVLLPFWNKLPLQIPLIREIFLCRIPVFIIGAYIGKLLFTKKNIVVNKYIVLLVFFFSLTIIVLLKLWSEIKNADYNITIIRLLFLPLALSFSLIFSHCLNKISYNKFFDKSFVFFGSISYTMFLIFVRILSYTKLIFNHFDLILISNVITSVIINAIAIAVSILLSIIVQRFSDKLNAYFKT